MTSFLIVRYCDWKSDKLNKYGDLEYQFVMKQLLLIALEYDVVEPFIRRSINDLMKYALLHYSLTQETIEVAIRIIEKCIPNVVEFTEVVSELISQLLYSGGKSEKHCDYGSVEEIQMQVSEFWNFCYTCFKIKDLA